MLHLLAAASLLFSASQVHAYDGCNNPDYYPCPPQTNSGGGGGGGGGFGATLPPNLLSGGIGFPSDVQGVAGDPIQVSDPGDSGRRVMLRSIAERQNIALCCRPAPVECRIWTEYNVPFCYVCPARPFSTLHIALPFLARARVNSTGQDPSDTRWFFADGSVYFADNGTYFGADGYDLDLVTGDYSWPNGTTGNIYVDQGESPPSSSTLALAAPTTGGSSAPTATDSVLSSATADGSSQTSMPGSSMTPSASAASGTPSGTVTPKSGAAKAMQVGTLVSGLGAFVLAAVYTLL
ncbi:hypothetical protein MMC26_004015 [Xylographa opegraphella]|nr:hypothetical protein [Xylographa opegraphella]